MGDGLFGAPRVPRLMESTSPRQLGVFVDVLSLAYHEARNVRHLIKAGHISAEGFERLRSLATNRVAAWKQIQSVRQAAMDCESIDGVVALFEGEFQLTIVGLVEIYRNPNWKGAAYGGNRWAEITSAIDLASRLFQAGESGATGELLGRIPLMEHNTGRVGEKLERLDAELGQAPSFVDEFSGPLEEESPDPAPRRSRRPLRPDEWGPAV